MDNKKWKAGGGSDLKRWQLLLRLKKEDKLILFLSKLEKTKEKFGTFSHFGQMKDISEKWQLLWRPKIDNTTKVVFILKYTTKETTEKLGTVRQVGQMANACGNACYNG